jgi:hypothetical protein
VKVLKNIKNPPFTPYPYSPLQWTFRSLSSHTRKLFFLSFLGLSLSLLLSLSKQHSFYIRRHFFLCVFCFHLKSFLKDSEREKIQCPPQCSSCELTQQTQVASTLPPQQQPTHSRHTGEARENVFSFLIQFKKKKKKTAERESLWRGFSKHLAHIGMEIGTSKSRMKWRERKRQTRTKLISFPY